MNQVDRGEVREMIHDILSGHQARIESQNVVINAGLERIEKHLIKLNGSVAAHEKIITQNLPHNISLCPQAENIKTLNDSMVTGKAIKGAIYRGIAITATIAGIVIAVIEMIRR